MICFRRAFISYLCCILVIPLFTSGCTHACFLPEKLREGSWSMADPERLQGFFCRMGMDEWWVLKELLVLSVSNFGSNLGTWDKWVHDNRSGNPQWVFFLSSISEVWRWTMCTRDKVFSAELILSQCSWDHSVKRAHTNKCSHTLSSLNGLV